MKLVFCNDLCIYFPGYRYLSIVHSIRKSVATIFLGCARAGLECGVSAEVKEENRVGEEREGDNEREKEKERDSEEDGRRIWKGACDTQARAPAR